MQGDGLKVRDSCIYDTEEEGDMRYTKEAASALDIDLEIAELVVRGNTEGLMARN